MLGAKLRELDAGGSYRVDLLTGARDRPDDRTMVESYVRHALELHGVAMNGFVTRFANELSRWSRCFPGITADEAAMLSYDLHRRHAAYVVAALASGIKAHAQALAEQRLPDSCLLRLVVGTSSMGLEIPRAAAEATAHGLDASSDHRNLDQTLDIEIALVSDGSHVLFPRVGQILGGTTFRILEQLIEPYLNDREAQRPIDQCRFTRAPALARALGITQETLRRRISTFRRKVAALFQEQCGLPLNCRQHYRDQELARLPPEPPGSPSEHGLRRKCRHVTLSGRPRHDSRISVSKINALAAPPVTAFDAAIHILAQHLCHILRQSGNAVACPGPRRLPENRRRRWKAHAS